MVFATSTLDGSG